MTTQFPYTRLPGVRRGLIRKAALWEGPDHIFLVSGTRFSEQYRRFYFRDVQALVTQRCARAGSVGVWLLTILFCAISAFFARSSVAVPVRLHLAAWIACSLLALYLAYRLLISLRYSCRCYIQTAVTWEELPSLYRIWNAQKALDRIRMKITEAQGALAGDPQTLAEEASFLSAAQAIHPPGRKTEESAESTYSTATSMNLALFGCLALLLIAAFLFWNMDVPGANANRFGMVMANALLSLLAGVGFVLSLLRIYKLRALHSLRNFLFAALGLLGLHIYFSSVTSRLYLQRDPVSIFLGSPAFRHWFGLIDGSFSLALGLFGVALIVFNWQNYSSEGQVSNS